jgi:hypothetical protein
VVFVYGDYAECFVHFRHFDSLLEPRRSATLDNTFDSFSAASMYLRRRIKGKPKTDMREQALAYVILQFSLL